VELGRAAKAGRNGAAMEFPSASSAHGATGLRCKVWDGCGLGSWLREGGARRLRHAAVACVDEHAGVRRAVAAARAAAAAHGASACGRARRSPSSPAHSSAWRWRLLPVAAWWHGGFCVLVSMSPAPAMADSNGSQLKWT
jgi:hypothetical protein